MSPWTPGGTGVADGGVVASERPNIVFFFWDNLGWGEPGCYGGGVLRGAATPRIDSLAAEGLRLLNFNVEPPAPGELRAEEHIQLGVITQLRRIATTGGAVGAGLRLPGRSRVRVTFMS